MENLLKKNICKGNWFESFEHGIKFHIKFGENEEYIELADGDKFWYKNNKLHREDGPAIEWATGYKEWYKNGLCIK